VEEQGKEERGEGAPLRTLPPASYYPEGREAGREESISAEEPSAQAVLHKENMSREEQSSDPRTQEEGDPLFWREAWASERAAEFREAPGEEIEWG